MRLADCHPVTGSTSSRDKGWHWVSRHGPCKPATRVSSLAHVLLGRRLSWLSEARITQPGTLLPL